ncbi:MAG: motility associated factor glycosyltransferase family protein [Spirochaetales bacterium]|nr:motility associated factor glycosyltransferase family protein [Spirochaetales bacterium]
MIATELLNRNLLALSSRESRLSSLLSQAESSPDVFFQDARNGDPIPVIKKDGRDFPLHSTFNPIKEAAKFAAEYPTGGYIIFLGFGCGYQIEPFLKRENVNNILIIDSNIGYLKAQLKSRDLRKIILDPRVHFLIDSSAEEVKDYVLSHCFPILTGDIQVIPLRSRINLDNQYFSTIFQTVKKTLESLADDFTVQTSFGKKWFVNTLKNLKIAETATAILTPISRALVTAAGPSLESDLENIDLSNTCLIATDTSYPALVKRGIKPDMVISIDCQHVSYHHFMSGYDPSIPLILDLASPPGLSRLSNSPLFFTSGHPYSIYINRYWRSFPFIDTSGGNVTHAAISLAEHLGAREIDIIGADFCYPSGKSYARGTYIYPHFNSLSDRVHQGEYLFYDFVFKNKQMGEKKIEGETVYQTYTLNEYRNRLTASFIDKNFSVRNLSPYSEPGDRITRPLETGRSVSKTTQFFGSGPADCSWKEFLSLYYARLIALPTPTSPLAGYFEQISPDNRALWLTLFPAAAAIRKQYSKQIIGTSDILKMAYTWSIDTIKRYL